MPTSSVHDRLDVDRQSDADHHLPLVGNWVRLLRVPYRLMFPSIVVFRAIGFYPVNNSPVDVVLTGAFGLVCYWSMSSSSLHCCSAWCLGR